MNFFFFFPFYRTPQEVLTKSINTVKDLGGKSHTLHDIVGDGGGDYLGKNQTTDKRQEISFPFGEATLYSVYDETKVLGCGTMFDGKSQVFSKRRDRPKA